MAIRTPKQNNALHLYLTYLADELNGAGLDMKKTLKPEIDIPWSKNTVKEHLFRPIMKALLQKDSTTDLTTGEINKVVEVLDRHLADKFGLQVNFPNIEEINKEI